GASKPPAAGGVGLAGRWSPPPGGLLLARPRILATRKAIAELRTDMPILAGAAGKAGTAIGHLGRAAGIATTAMIGLQVASQFLSDSSPVAGANQMERAIRDVANSAGALDEIFSREAGGAWFFNN